MQTITVKYREREYSIQINEEKTILDLKKAVSERTDINNERFGLKIQQITCCDDKEISDYKDYGTVYTMTDVKIAFTVILKGKDHSYYAPETLGIDNVIRQIIKIAQYTNEISLLFNGKKLEDTATLVSSGVEQGCVLTVIDGTPIINTMTSLTINYRNEMFLIEIDETKTVLQLKEAISKLTGIKMGNFSLGRGQIFLLDSNMIRQYIEDGTTFTMKNVTIKILVQLNGIENIFFILEEEKIDHFKKVIKTKFGLTRDISLYNNSGTICRNITLVASGIKNDETLIAIIDNVSIKYIEQLTVVYRHDSYSLIIATYKTVLQLKDKVSVRTGLDVKNFTLQLHWISLVDTQPIAEYMKFGTNLKMTNVIINIFVRLDKLTYNFTVPEEMTIKDFKEKIIKKTKHKTDLSLSYNGEELSESDTLAASNVEHRSTVIVISMLQGGLK